MQIKEISTHEEVSLTFDLMVQIYEDLKRETYSERALSLMKHGYKMAGIFENKSSGNVQCIGAVGMRISKKLHYGKVAEIEDFVIDQQKQGVGVGKMLVHFVEWQAAIAKCDNIIGSFETKRQEVQKIFARERFILDGFVFRKKI